MAMTPKAQVRKMLDRLPDDASLLDIAESVYVLHRVQLADEQIERGEYKTHAEVVSEVQSWFGTKSSGRKPRSKISAKSVSTSKKTPLRRRAG